MRGMNTSNARRLCLLALSVLLLVTRSGAGDQALAEQPTAGVPIPDDAVATILQEHHVPGVSIAVIHDGRIDWAKGYGVRESRKGDRVDTDTLFQAASISKPVSAAAALGMVARNQLALDEDVNRRLESWKVPENELTRDEPVTLRRLLSHSAGLTMHGVPEFTAGAEVPTLVQILNGEFAAAKESMRLVAEPGSVHRYSGGGYIVLQLLLTDVAGRPFAPLARELVLRPAGMSSSTFEQPLPERLRHRAAVGHHRDGTPIRGSWHTLPEQAAGGLWTTPGDLAHFMIEVWRSYHGQSETLLPQRLARLMLTPQIGEFGLGFYLPDAGVARFQHGGGNAGYRCHTVLSVGTADGVVIMTNGDGGEQVIWKLFEVIAQAYGWKA